MGVHIQIPIPGVAPTHCELHVSPVGITVTPRAAPTVLNGRPIAAPVAMQSGDVLELGGMQLQLVDHAPATSGSSLVMPAWFRNLPAWGQVGAWSGVLAVSLILVTLGTGNPRLVPITAITCAAVVPLTFLSYVFIRHGSGAASLRSVGVTVALGATLGCVLTIGLHLVLPLGTSAMFAPICEEPAKLLATAWCWHRAGYRNPRAGLILGLAAGTGFAVAETAGYVFETTGSRGVEVGLVTLVLRSLLAPFSHAVWTAAAASAWFQMGWHFRGPWPQVFLKSLLIATLLHAAWNSMIFPVSLGSAVASGYLFRRLLSSRGTWTARWTSVP